MATEQFSITIMKNFKGDTISKKNIQSVLRTMDATKIFRLVHIIYGGKVERMKVYDFIKEFAPTNKVWDAAYWIAYTRNEIRPEEEWKLHNAFRFRQANQKHEAIQCLRENLQDVHSPYAKRPMMGHTHLYFCSPVYGHRDYNKWQSIEIKGNEQFCNTICRLADNYFSM